MVAVANLPISRQLETSMKIRAILIPDDYNRMWVASCLDFNLSAQGQTKAEARERLYLVYMETFRAMCQADVPDNSTLFKESTIEEFTFTTGQGLDKPNI